MKDPTGFEAGSEFEFENENTGIRKNTSKNKSRRKAVANIATIALLIVACMTAAYIFGTVIGAEQPDMTAGNMSSEISDGATEPAAPADTDTAQAPAETESGKNAVPTEAADNAEPAEPTTEAETETETEPATDAAAGGVTDTESGTATDAANGTGKDNIKDIADIWWASAKEWIIENLSTVSGIVVSVVAVIAALFAKFGILPQGINALKAFGNACEGWFKNIMSFTKENRDSINKFIAESRALMETIESETRENLELKKLLAEKNTELEALRREQTATQTAMAKSGMLVADALGAVVDISSVSQVRKDAIFEMLSDAGKEINMLIGKSAGADTGNPDKPATVGRPAGDGTDNNKNEKI